MPTVHLLCGYVGSGKTTLARELAARHAAVRFTLDEWMLALHPELAPYDEDYGDRAARCQDVIWGLARQVLALGHDVVLDWSQWSAERRRRWADRAEEAGATTVVHFLDVPLETAITRVTARNRTVETGTETETGADVHRIDPDEMRRFAETFFEPPHESEGITILRER